jgi:hypothetical protein
MFCKKGDEYLGFTKRGKFIGNLNQYQLRKNYSSIWRNIKFLRLDEIQICQFVAQPVNV